MAETLEIGANELFKGEIDTSAPFESVKEAVTMFGGLGFYKPVSSSSSLTKPSPNSLLSCDAEGVDIGKGEEQTAELEKELILKERDTLEVSKELEETKVMVEELKSKLPSDEATSLLNIDADKPSLTKKQEVEEKDYNPDLSVQNKPEGSSTDLAMSSSPCVILMELKHAQMKLTKATSDLSELRESVELYTKKIDSERMSLAKTRESLQSSTSKLSSVEEDINQTRSKLHETTNAIPVELQLEEAAKSAEIMKVMSQVELTKAEIKTAEIRLVAARKMKEASWALVAGNMVEIKALDKSDTSNPISENITLTLEEYSSLKSKVCDADELSNLKVLKAMRHVDDANMSEENIIKQVEEAMEEVETSKRVLEDVLERVEAANSAKLAVEEARRKWRIECGERKRSLMLDLNGINLLGADANASILKPTLSIGQILSRKLLITEEFESRKSCVKRKVSLSQILGKQNGKLSFVWNMDKSGKSNLEKLPAKRKFGFTRFSVLLPRQSQKKNKSSLSARFNFLSSGCKGELQEIDQLAFLKI